MQCGPCFVVHHGFPSNAVAETVTATQKTARRSTGLQQSGSGPLKGGVEITAENLKGEVPNDKYRNALCTKLLCAQTEIYVSCRVKAENTKLCFQPRFVVL